MAIWNPWHGCKKISSGCQNCYVYRRDAEFGKDSSIVVKTTSFDLPIKKNRNKEYILKADAGEVFTCMTSDFFVEDADQWRDKIWNMIRIRQDLHFVIITKRIHRFYDCIPEDWDNGYDNVSIMCTCENQDRADFRLPIFLEAPIKHKSIIYEPMLERIDIERYLQSGQIDGVTCGGESGENARLCNYSWILNTMNQCKRNNVSFYFKQTGSVFKKDNKIYHIERKNQMKQAEKANISFKSTEV